MTRFEQIQSENKKVKFLTTLTHEIYAGQQGQRVISFNCKDLTVFNSGDFEVILEGEIILQPGQSLSYGADEGEYIVANLTYRFGNQIGPDAGRQFFTVIRKQYAE